MWWANLYGLIHMSHARYYNACCGLTHTLYSANGIQLLLHTVMRWSLPFNTHVTCSLLPWLTHTLYSIQHTECSICYIKCWDELYRSMHMSHAITKHVGDSHIHCIQQMERSSCYTLCWDELCRSMHMSHAITKHVGDSHIHCIQQTDTVIVTHCVRTSFTVQCKSHARY